MKKLLNILLLSLMIASVTIAQEEPIPPKRSRMVKVGLFGGFTPGWLFLDVKPVNEFLLAGKGAALNDGGVFLSGGAGAAYIMLLPNVRVGGMGMSGALKSASVDLGGIRRDAKLAVGFGGLTIEYVLPLVERLDLALGGMLGWGGLDLTLRQSNGGTNTWVGEQNLFASWTAGSPGNMTRTLSGSFFVWSPSVNIEYAVLGWLGLRVGASYVGMAIPSWSVDANYDLLGVPSTITGNGLMLQAGLFIGTY